MEGVDVLLNAYHGIIATTENATIAVLHEMKLKNPPPPRQRDEGDTHLDAIFSSSHVFVTALVRAPPSLSLPGG